MDQISAAGNLTIELNADRWRLLANGSGEAKVLVECLPGKPIQYAEMFASKRRLSQDGKLALNSVQRVVLGWSHEDESWHLGLLLGADVAQRRGSRWCEMARWPDPEQNVFSDVATRAGRALARTLTRPFNLIEPQAQPTPVAAPPPLRPLPLALDIWTLERNSALQFSRSPAWARSKILRVLFYSLLTAVYVVLSVVTLQKFIALPKPEFLPYLGLATAALLVVVVLHTIYQLITYPNAIVVENDSMVAQHGGSDRWRVSKGDIQAVYVSEIVNKKGPKRIVYHGELNLFLRDGTFQPVLELPQTFEDDTPGNKEDVVQEAIFLLTAFDAHSDLQMAGLYLAAALQVECRYDRRVR